MVGGIEKFREFFAGQEDKYAIIGGSACDIIFDAAGVPFRATKDIDMVICVEVVDPDLGRQFAAFLRAGGYEAHERSEGKPQFHRFSKPRDDSFPFMLELFSRMPETFDLSEAAILAPVEVEEDVVSLSAILLNKDYFEALLAFKRVENGVSILDERLLIPFKAKAFLDLSERKEVGEAVDQKQIDKHLRDVFRLLQLLAPDERIALPASISADLARFVDRAKYVAKFDPKSLKLPFSLDEGFGRLVANYGLSK